MKKIATIQTLSICLAIVSTAYSFIYVSLLWLDYFCQTSIHIAPYLIYLFFIFGFISLLLSYPTLRIVKSRYFTQAGKENSHFIGKCSIILSRINIIIVILNLFALLSWVTFIAGPGV